MSTKKHSRSYRLFRIFISKNRTKVSHALDTFFYGLKSEAKDTVNTTHIIQKYILHSGEITPEEEKFLKLYVYDMLKIAGIGIPFILLPGASIIIPFLLKAAEKRNIDLMPSNFKGKPNNKLKH
ncbi:hypothetical protein AXE80_07805 [Wenyingzhuangia fucanilytica]|uniref:Letm1 RBD domain-containing protein n=1 Tax=Wenyingzhuangia fucanilytica TaxID=1790137 RepID=A0A1B1Y610_9FLAO|nr:hypothetical protein [Wenyingzhuangia fucanilytica]ANW96187.1 hypothetical protein AXE80_07805 [Wenyingzhuangia fucanilytica]